MYDFENDGGGAVAEFIRYELEDGSEVLFESAEASLVSLRGGGDPGVTDAGTLGDRLRPIAAAAGEVAKGMRPPGAPCRSVSHRR